MQTSAKLPSADPHNPQAEAAAQLLRDLRGCLARLDTLAAESRAAQVAAAQLDACLHTLHNAFVFDDITSE